MRRPTAKKSYLINRSGLAFGGCQPEPESHARERDAEEAAEGEGQQRCSPNQVEARWSGPFHQSPRCWDDPVAQVRGQAICAELWRDPQQGDLDLSLNRYHPLVEGRDQDLLDALRSLAEEKKQARVTHA